jgi:aspartate aminotransferase-like enzyme
MFAKPRLFIPGPTPVPETVLSAMARPMINHRGKAFGALYNECMQGVQWLLETKGDVFPMNGSGTAGLETAIVNFFSPGDKVLNLITGVFGRRWTKIAKAFGLDAQTIEFPLGTAVDPAQVREALKAGGYKAVLITHNETSTGILNPVAEVAAIAREAGVLICVDAISSVGSTPLKIDEWQLDVVVAASQKSFLLPPGLAFVTVSEKAWKAHAEATCPRFNWDLSQAKDFGSKGQTPWTPPITLYYGLQEAFKILRAEGLEAMHQRHETLMKAARAGVRALGLELLVPNDAHASRAVTAVRVPEGFKPGDIRTPMNEKFGIDLAGGQADLKDSIFRIGHLGYQDATDILGCFGALEIVLSRLGRPVEFGSAVKAVQQQLMESGY